MEAGHPLSPKELLEAARTHVKGIGIATVYRNIKSLHEEGWLTPVELPGEPPRYEVAGKGHHHHFHCRTCDRVFEVEGCPGNLLSVTPEGFHLERHEFVLYGLCVQCAA
jgi:Fur family transcriptional regulator, ferric uptake regulator